MRSAEWRRSGQRRRENRCETERECKKQSESEVRDDENWGNGRRGREMDGGRKGEFWPKMEGEWSPCRFVWIDKLPSCCSLFIPTLFCLCHFALHRFLPSSLTFHISQSLYRSRCFLFLVVVHSSFRWQVTAFFFIDFSLYLKIKTWRSDFLPSCAVF